MGRWPKGSPDLTSPAYSWAMHRVVLLGLLLLSACHYVSPVPEPVEVPPLPGAEPALLGATECEAFETDLAAENQRELEALNALLSESNRVDAPVDWEELRQFSLQYRRAWTVHRAPHVIAGQVTGRGGELGRSALVEHAQYSITRDFRGNTTQNYLSRESAAGQDRCASHRILATGAFGADVPGSLICSAAGSVLAFSPSTPILAELQDTPATRAAVSRWLHADEPLLQLHPATSTLPPKLSRLGAYAPWSAPLSVMQGLAAAHGLLEVTVAQVQSGPDGHRVWVDLKFDEITGAQLSFECGDPRLLQTGARWLLPFVLDLSQLRPESLFFIPGLAFDREGPARQIHRELATVLNNTGP